MAPKTRLVARDRPARPHPVVRAPKEGMAMALMVPVPAAPVAPTAPALRLSARPPRPLRQLLATMKAPGRLVLNILPPLRSEPLLLCSCYEFLYELVRGWMWVVDGLCVYLV